jgi:hypothetical protein
VAKIDSTTTAGIQSTGISNRYGLIIDCFLFNPTVYLSLQGGGFSYLGDTYSFYSGGLGAGF